MKLGSIVGIVFSCLLIIAGIVLCVKGKNEAEAADQLLFAQRSEDGSTYYCEKIAEGTNRVKIQFKDADVTVIGGAEKSQIEFKNFNPNLYSVSVTPNIVSFEEIPSLTSIVDIGENGINFKGLRYLLDFENYNYDDLKKSIVISLADNTDLKVLDISGENSTVKLQNLNLDGDLSLKIDSGNVTVENMTTTSTLEIIGSSLTSVIKGFVGSTLRFNSETADLNVTDCSVKDTEINVNSGNVEYHTDDVLTGAFFNILTKNGVITINDEVVSNVEYSSPEGYEKSLNIVSEDAYINITYTEEIASDTTQTPSDTATQ